MPSEYRARYQPALDEQQPQQGTQAPAIGIDHLVELLMSHYKLPADVAKSLAVRFATIPDEASQQMNGEAVTLALQKGSALARQTGQKTADAARLAAEMLLNGSKAEAYRQAAQSIVAGPVQAYKRAATDRQGAAQAVSQIPQYRKATERDDFTPVRK